MKEERDSQQRSVTTRILVVDSHPIVCEGLRTLLARLTDSIVLEMVNNAENAAQRLSQMPVDLVVIEIALDGESGIDVVRQMRQRDASVPILVLSIHDEQAFASHALAAGASGYLNKRNSIEHIVQAIQFLLNMGNSTARTQPPSSLRFPGGNAPLPEASGISLLTHRELEVFTLIGHGLSTAQIATKLDLSTTTVDSHRQSIRRKMRLANASELAREATRWIILHR